MEDYLEVIAELIGQKGYARTIEISESLHVKPPSATKMIQHLHKLGFLEYERYRGITLTRKGKQLADSVSERHSLIHQFLLILGVDDQTAHADAEGIEHHLHARTVGQITKFVKFVTANSRWFEQFRNFDRNRK
jgi:Mn-dependent DtxR family transcriptional regulator